jgi:hypothetical protein
MNNYQGVIIEESLENKDILKNVKILNTKIEKATEEHETPWLSRWTLHSVEIPENEAKEIAEKISQSLKADHGGTWYVDFKNDTHHFIIFRNKIFYIDRKNKEQYDEAERYGLSIGTPAHQLINYEGEYKDAT